MEERDTKEKETPLSKKNTKLPPSLEVGQVPVAAAAGAGLPTARTRSLTPP